MNEVHSTYCKSIIVPINKPKLLHIKKSNLKKINDTSYIVKYALHVVLCPISYVHRNTAAEKRKIH